MTAAVVVGRIQYRKALKDALRRSVEGYALLSLEQIEQRLAQTFEFDMPARTTIARTMSSIGWRRAAEPGASSQSAIYVRDSVA
ncbi:MULTISPECIES: hypothetical protein [Novosphingobium]|uniref:hypothetical protein n=1 Tax=Novosphingobium TaxID=165696 RepID=UPI000D30EE19|nr:MULTISPECIES: hypothetical protein [Novosphingobium]PTR07901.1 hypothetical protein C8K11_113112 [Novosphingobium sp. GV055]PUB00714.1 hypothetical protein C8K12_113112 [Novosphingobium sp. GV061]PUB16123.1 hypothetical protein C8K14_113112 [Novosphingobium sp. GV079]PUB39588.1 hypothetical protein C8K10_113112 [Novosphingobium sp. GV027]WQD93743.1 hypothetical protein U0041_03870 [Novosphingobium capsulatum]